MSDSDRSGRGIQTKHVVVGALVAVLVLFAALNSNEVNVDLIVTDFDVSLIFVIAVSAALGLGIGYFVKARRD